MRSDEEYRKRFREVRSESPVYRRINPDDLRGNILRSATLEAEKDAEEESWAF